MKLVGFVPPTPHPLWTLCPQMGVTGVVVKIHPDLTGLPAPALAGLALAARRTAKAASERLFSATTLHLLLSVFAEEPVRPFPRPFQTTLSPRPQKSHGGSSAIEELAWAGG